MKRFQQQATAFLLLIIIGIPAFLFIFFQARQWHARKEMEEKMERMHLVSLELKVGNVVWYKKGKEIIVDGRLFDVKTMTIHNEFVSFTGIFDEKETLIKLQLEKLQKRNHADKDDGNFVAKYISLLLYVSPTRGFNFESLLPYEVALNFFHQKDHLSPPLSAPDRPPRIS